MTRLIGTGTDPLNRYANGVVYDLEDEESVQEHVDRGWAVLADDEPSPIHIAAAVVRGDGTGGGLLLDEEKTVAERIGDRALAIVHEDDPDAPAEAAQPPPGEGRRWTRLEPKEKRRRR